MSYSLLSLGELLVDLVPSGRVGSLYRRAAGGAPANVAAGAARLLGRGHRVGFAGGVGDDPFGHFLRDTLTNLHVDTQHLSLSHQVQTPCAVVGHMPGSEDIDYTFYGPDDGKRLSLLDESTLPESDLTESRIVVLGGVSLSHPLSAAASVRAIEIASRGRALVALDPNWRAILWDNPNRWVAAVRGLLPQVDILKTSRSELALLTGQDDFARSITVLSQVSTADRSVDRPLLLAVTMGAQGSVYALFPSTQAGDSPAATGTVPTLQVRSIDPTGAGDAFLAGLLSWLLLNVTAQTSGARIDLQHLTRADLQAAFGFANATAALSTTRRGAMTGQPTRKAVLHAIGAMQLTF
ncbi:MAG: PfkB family carbohydrate kinase [Chloroflexota bacterium]|nr:PfkB family carbohydrate kinase [Chloroflexota bacterium]